jgi:hypothetical protein
MDDDLNHGGTVENDEKMECLGNIGRILGFG